MCSIRGTNKSRYYHEVIRRKPSRISDTLRMLHSQEDSGRFSLAHELASLFADGPQQKSVPWDDYFASGLHILLLDMVADRQNHVSARDDLRYKVSPEN